MGAEICRVNTLNTSCEHESSQSSLGTFLQPLKTHTLTPKTAGVKLQRARQKIIIEISLYPTMKMVVKDHKGEKKKENMV